MYIPDQFLRNLTPQRMPDRQQRDMDQQVGIVVAAIARPTRRLARRVQTLAARIAEGSNSRLVFESHAASSSGDGPAVPGSSLRGLRPYRETAATACSCSAVSGPTR
jgi:hypothetical protein